MHQIVQQSMLSDPSDLEAVLWLEEYLKGYPKTVLLVSHDKAFLNEVCTDIVMFANLKLTYFKGNYDSFAATYKEMRIVQQKQHEAQMVKIAHMQEFVDKFRYNAKRASLVQSRIKVSAHDSDELSRAKIGSICIGPLVLAILHGDVAQVLLILPCVLTLIALIFDIHFCTIGDREGDDRGGRRGRGELLLQLLRRRPAGPPHHPDRGGHFRLQVRAHCGGGRRHSGGGLKSSAVL